MRGQRSFSDEELARLTEGIGSAESPGAIAEPNNSSTYAFLIYRLRGAYRKGRLKLLQPLREGRREEGMSVLYHDTPTATLNCGCHCQRCHDQSDCWDRASGRTKAPTLMYPHRCPICAGKGWVPLGFYASIPTQPSTGCPTETCRSCWGRGIVWTDETKDDQP